MKTFKEFLQLKEMNIKCSRCGEIGVISDSKFNSGLAKCKRCGNRSVEKTNEQPIKTLYACPGCGDKNLSIWDAQKSRLCRNCENGRNLPDNEPGYVFNSADGRPDPLGKIHNNW